MIRTLVMILLLIHSSNSQCAIGCLACDGNGACLFCDTPRNFYLSETTCVLSTQKNCVVISQSNACLVCQSPGFYLDPVTQSCVAVPSNATVPNCAAHSAPSVCATCQPGFYASAVSGCLPANATIPNCLTFDTESTCQVCAPGSSLANNRTVCTLATGPPNCALASQAQCLRCKSGYTLAPASRLARLQKSFFSPNFASTITQTIKNSQGFSNLPLPVCFTIPNCLEYSPTDFTCTLCQSGFSFNATSGRCFRNPLPRMVDFCEVYQTATTCARCIEGYLMTTPTSCVPLVRLADCLTHDSSASVPKCLSCAPSAYLTPRGNCLSRRIFNISNCLSYAPDADACLACQSPYQPTTDRQACLLSIIGCLSYAPSGAQNTFLTCLKCGPGTYLTQSGRMCTAGTIPNCETYSPSANQCLVCANTFRLVNGACVSVSSISFCSVYSRVLDLKCDICNPNAVKFTIQTGCTATRTFNNCRVFGTSTTCATCQDGYYLTPSRTVCAAISAPNCGRFVGPTCTQCKPGFYFAGNNCVSPSFMDSINCDTDVMYGTYAGESVAGCRRCNAQSVPLDTANAYMCIPSAVIDAVYSPNPLPENCVGWTFNPNTQTYSCSMCRAGYVTPTGCAPTCPPNVPVIYLVTLPTMTNPGKYLHSEVGSFATCGPALAAVNCEWASPTVLQTTTTPSYGCYSCMKGFIPLVTLNSPMVLKISLYGGRTFGPSYFRCHPPSTPTVGAPVNDCAAYITYSFYPKIVCIRCAFGTTGPVRTEISRCSIYNAGTCLQCLPRFHPTADRLNCEADVDIPGCLHYDSQTAGSTSCLLCDLASYLRQPAGAGFSCLPRDAIASCDTYHEAKNECLICAANKSLVEGRCYNTIPMCKIYRVLNPGILAECLACDDSISEKFRADNGIGLAACRAVTPIAGCVQYAQKLGSQTSTCVQCAESKILSFNTCLNSVPAITGVGRCTEGGPLTCTTCYHTTNKFKIKNLCTLPLPIAGCLVYQSFFECLICETGKYLENSQRCSDIPASTNCLEYVPVDRNLDGMFTADDRINGAYVYTCRVCKPGFSFSNITVTTTGITYDKAVCVSYIGTAIANCAQNGMSDDGTGNILEMGCTGGCAPTYLPMSMDGLRICVPTSTFSGTAPYLTIPNCMYYKRTGSSGNYICQLCESGFGYDSAKNQCLEQCADGKYLALYVYSANNGAYKITQRNACIDLPVGNPPIPANCWYIVPTYLLPTSGSTFNYICGQCSKNYSAMTVMEPTGQGFSPIRPTKSSSFIPIRSPQDPYTQIKACILSTNVPVSGYSGSPNGVEGACAIYGYVSPTESTYTCIRCADGYVGKIRKRADSAKAPTVMYQCSLVPINAPPIFMDFNVDSRILSTFGSLQTIFSLTTCPLSVPVPTVFLALNDQAPYQVLGWFHYAERYNEVFPNEMSLASFAASSSLVNAEVPSFACLDPAIPSHWTKYLDPGQSGPDSIIPNCGLYVINTNAVVKSASPIVVNSPTTRALICVACLPGYKPTYGNYGSWYYVSACTRIINCGGTTMFSGCAPCPFNRLADGSVDFGACVSQAPSNCLLADSADSNKCLLCYPGYLLNILGTACVLLPATNGCSSWQISNTFEKALGDPNNGFRVKHNLGALLPYYAFKNFGGCSACQANFVMVESAQANDRNIIPQLCLAKSDLLISESVAPFTTANCASFGFKKIPGKLTITSCVLCTATYVLSFQGELPDSCVAVSSVTSHKVWACEYWDPSAKICLRCRRADSFLVSGMCLAIGTASSTTFKCVKWDLSNTMSSDFQWCMECLPGYSAPNGSCILNPPSTPAGCLVFNGVECVRCSPGYSSMRDLGQVFCIKIVSGTLTNDSVMPHDSRCRTVLYTEYNLLNLECSECVPGSFPQAVPAQAPQEFCHEIPERLNVNCANFDDYGLGSQLVKQVCVKCSSNNLFYLVDGQCQPRRAIPNCAHYFEDADACQNCGLGFSLNPTTGACDPFIPYLNKGFTPTVSTRFKDILPNVRGYIETCNSYVNDCDQTKMLYGIEAPFVHFFACHLCGTPGNIPFAYLMAGNGTYSGVSGLYSWGENSTTNAMGNYEDGLSVRCLQPTASSFHSAFAGKFNFPSNCALGIVNVWGAFDASHSASATGVDRTKITVMCVACSPRFKPTGATDASGQVVPGMVAACSPIAFCSSSILVDRCENCVAGYALKLDASGNVDRTSCHPIPASVTNCKVLTPTSSCAICIENYFMNLDGICEPFRSPNCVPEFTANNQKNLNGVNIIDALIFQPFRGCMGCLNGFQMVVSPVPNLVCHVSDLIGSVRPANSKFTPNCALYLRAITSENRVLCDACKPGYTLTTVNTCVASPDPNCRLAISATVCSVCSSSSFLIINGVCTLMNTPNCLSYSQTILTALTCINCSPSFRLVNNRCVLGTVFGCAKYSDQGSCYQCLPDFVVSRDANGTFSCVQAPVTMNCLIMDDSLYNQFQFGCLVCLPNHFPNANPLNRDICLVFPEVPGCVSYDIGPTVSLSTQRCSACVSNMYLNTITKLCVARSAASLANCQVASPTADTCLTPVSSAPAGPSPAETSPAPMSPQPTGIAHCLVYTESLNCLSCSPSRYSNGTYCLPLDPTKEVPNCIGYSSAQVCIKCAPDFILRVGLCVGVVGSNCDAIDPVRGDCRTCKNGHGIFDVNGFSQCLPLNDTNCTEWSSNFPYPCTLCTSGFALVNGNCTGLNQTVPNCQFHFADGICAQCAPGFTLNSSASVATNPNATVCSRTSSLNLQGYLDPNCDTFAASDSGFCYLCVAGFTLQNGTCAPCQTAPGCMVCDPTDPSRCLVCQSDYFNNGTGTCYPNSVFSPSKNLNGSSDNQTGFQPGSAPAAPVFFPVCLMGLVHLLHPALF